MKVATTKQLLDRQAIASCNLASRKHAIIEDAIKNYQSFVHVINDNTDIEKLKENIARHTFVLNVLKHVEETYRFAKKVCSLKEFLQLTEEDQDLESTIAWQCYEFFFAGTCDERPTQTVSDDVLEFLEDKVFGDSFGQLCDEAKKLSGYVSQDEINMKELYSEIEAEESRITKFLKDHNYQPYNNQQ